MEMMKKRIRKKEKKKEKNSLLRGLAWAQGVSLCHPQIQPSRWPVHRAQSHLQTVCRSSLDFGAEHTNKKHNNPLPKVGLTINMAQEEVLHAYRHLYRAALRAVCYSQPASTVARDQLRRAFRDKANTFNRDTVRRTVWFLKNAARESGTEHKIVKSLLFTRFCKDKANYRTWKYITDSTWSKKKYVGSPSCAVFFLVTYGLELQC